MSERPQVDQQPTEQIPNPSRRVFLQGLGAFAGGIAIASTLGETGIAKAQEEGGTAAPDNTDLIATDGSIVDPPGLEPGALPTGPGTEVADTTADIGTEALFFNFHLSNLYEDPESQSRFKRRTFTPDQISSYEGIQIKGPKEFQNQLIKIIDTAKLDSVRFSKIKEVMKSLEMVDGPSANWLDKQTGPLIGVNDIYGDGGYGIGFDPELNPNFIINSAAELVRVARYTELVGQGNPMARVTIRSASGPVMTPELSSLYTQANIEGAKTVRDFVVTIKQPQGIIDYYERRLALFNS